MLKGKLVLRKRRTWAISPPEPRWLQKIGGKHQKTIQREFKLESLNYVVTPKKVRNRGT